MPHAAVPTRIAEERYAFESLGNIVESRDDQEAVWHAAWFTEARSKRARPQSTTHASPAVCYALIQNGTRLIDVRAPEAIRGNRADPRR